MTALNHLNILNVFRNKFIMCLKKIQLEHLHKKLNAKMISFSGFLMPLYYEGIVREHNHVRNNVGVFDVSHMGQIFIEGKEATNLIQKVSSNDISLVETNGVQYSYLPNQKGGVVDDLLIYKFHINKYMLVLNASNIKKYSSRDGGGNYDKV